MSDIYVFLAEGFEEIEALTPVDICRRASLDVKTVSINDSRIVTGSHGIPVTADLTLSEADFQGTKMLVLPGGMPGTNHLEACGPLMEALDAFHREGKFIGAICAAPRILGHRGILNGHRACCFPGNEEALAGAEVVFEPAVISGKIVTGRGMGCAVDFSLAIVELLLGKENAQTIREKIVFPY